MRAKMISLLILLSTALGMGKITLNSYNEVKSWQVVKVSYNNFVYSTNTYDFVLNDKVVNSQIYCREIPKISCDGNLATYVGVIGYYIVDDSGQIEIPVGLLTSAEDTGGNLIKVCVAIPTANGKIYFSAYSEGDSTIGKDSYVYLEVNEVCKK